MRAQLRIETGEGKPQGYLAMKIRRALPTLEDTSIFFSDDVGAFVGGCSLD
jgi:hypothetical protein